MGSLYLFLAIGAVVIAFVTLVWVVSRYRRCPSDRVLVVYGKVGGQSSSRCVHGGAAFIWPIFQDYQYLDLTPMPIDIKLEGALSQQNIRVNTPSTFTVGISTEPGIMENAAERMLNLTREQIQELAKDIIFGQMRVVIATMPIEAINADREKLIKNIEEGVQVELNKVGLRLINVNIQDITDESGYIEALGKEAAARAINEAKIKVAEQERDGEIGKAGAERDQRVQVADAHASAVEGENLAKVRVANSAAALRQKEAEAERAAIAAERVKQAQAFQEAYAAEEEAERQRAKREEQSQIANIIIPAEIEKRRVETLAEAEAERTRRTKKGEADGVRAMMEAEAMGLMAILTRKAEGFAEIIRACSGIPELASLLMVTEQLPKLVEEQVKAISNLKIDSVTVWEGGKQGNGKSSTADFVSSLVGALPPLHELTKNVGVKLPEYLGRLRDDPEQLAIITDSLKKKASQVGRAFQKVRDWVAQNSSLIVSFDRNKDSKLDETEMATAVKTAVKWAEHAFEPEAKWYYAKGQQSAGPYGWDELQKYVRDDRKTFVNFNKSEYWLPFEAIDLALQSIEV
jgi:flotillin